jgi:hypothetical protein
MESILDYIRKPKPAADEIEQCAAELARHREELDANLTERRALTSDAAKRTGQRQQAETAYGRGISDPSAAARTSPEEPRAAETRLSRRPAS